MNLTEIVGDLSKIWLPGQRVLNELRKLYVVLNGAYSVCKIIIFFPLPSYESNNNFLTAAKVAYWSLC